MHAITIENLSKDYKTKKSALENVSLTINNGQFFGLLGPNGAGKSTTIGIISSIVKKTSGNVKICGVDIDKDIEKAKQFLGVVPQEFNFNIFETCLQIVINQGGYYGVPYLEAKKEPCIFLIN